MSPHAPQAAGTQATAPAADAQDGAAAAAPEAKPGGKAQDENTLESIVVTARRREENLQQVPLAVTAISGEGLEQKGIENLMDLQKFVPSLRVVSADVNPKIFFISMRGLRGQNPRLTEDPPVGTYYAETVVAHPFAFGDSLFDLQSVQVLKGPQGTLFGRNTIGGAVLIEPNRPSFSDGFGGYVKGTLGSYNWRKLTAVLNAPLNEVVALRFAGEINKRDGYTTNVLSGQKYDEVNNQAGRLSLLLRPSSTISSNTIVDYLKEDAAPSSTQISKLFPLQFGLNPAYAQVLAVQEQLGARQIYSAVGSNIITGPGIDAMAPARCATDPTKFCRESALPFEKTRIDSVINNTRVEFDHFTIKNIVGYRHMDHLISTYDIIPGGLIAPGLQARQRNNYYQWSEELQLSGKAFDDRLDWITGFYLFHEHGSDRSPAYQFTAANWTFNQNVDTNESKAVYAQASYKVTEQWKATLGVRQSWDHREAHDVSTATTNGVVSCAAQDETGKPLPYPNCDLIGKRSWKAPTWNVSLEYQPQPGTLIYGAVRRGYKSGGFSPLIRIPQKFIFDPEYLTDTEVGVKSDWKLAGMPVRTNVAVFYSKYRNQQVQVSDFVAGAGFRNFINNAGKSHIYAARLSSLSSRYRASRCLPSSPTCAGNTTST